MKKIVGRVEKVVNGGYGLIRDEKIGVVFVPNVLPEEEIEVDIVKNRKEYSFGKLKRILTLSKFRIESECPYFGVCGGCSFFNIPYDYEIHLKKGIFKDIWKEKVENVNFISSPVTKGYRIKARIHISDGFPGFFRPKTRELVNISHCLLLHPKINEFLENKKKVSVPDGDLEIITNGEKVVSSLYLDDYKEKILKIEIGGFNYFLSTNTFFQSNPFILPYLFSIIKENINKDDSFVEFYAGNGLFSVLLAKHSSFVVSVESSKYSKNLYFETMKENQVANFKFYSLTDKKFILKSYKRGNGFNKVFLDPPRSGISNVLRDFIVKKRFAEILYLSCDISTQKRDVNFFLKNGYKIKKMYLLDFFPKTHHIESFIILKK